MAYPIEINKVAFVKTTDEPVFVVAINGDTAIVRRPINTEATGVEHRIEQFAFDELQTAEAKLVSEMEFTKFSLKMRDAYTEERKQEQQKSASPASDVAVKETYLN